MSTFGQYFRVSTYGESHGKSVGCIVDGVPPGLKLTEDDIQPQMTRRRPGQSALTTPRDEKDRVGLRAKAHQHALRPKLRRHHHRWRCVRASNATLLLACETFDVAS